MKYSNGGMLTPGEEGASRPFHTGFCTEPIRAGTERAREQQGERPAAQRGCGELPAELHRTWGSKLR